MFLLIFSCVFSLGGLLTTRVHSFHLSQMSAFFCKVFFGGHEQQFSIDVRVPVPEGYLRVVKHVKFGRYDFVSTMSGPYNIWETFGE